MSRQENIVDFIAKNLTNRSINLTPYEIMAAALLMLGVGVIGILYRRGLLSCSDQNAQTLFPMSKKTITSQSPAIPLLHWMPDGNPNFANTAVGMFAMNGSGTSYFAYLSTTQNSTQGPEVSVMTLQNGTWVPAGKNSVIAANSYLNGFAMAINSKDPNAYPYVVYAPFPGRLTVVQFDGSSWNSVGADTLPVLISPLPAAVAIAVDHHGAPYVVLQECLPQNNTRIFKFNGKAWETVGGTLTMKGVPSIAVDCNQTVCLAWQEGHRDSDIHISTLQNNNWVSLPSIENSHAMNNTPLAIDENGIIYIAYNGKHCSPDVKFTPHVVKFNANQEAWEPVGNFSPDCFCCNYPSLQLSSTGVPYVFFADENQNIVVLTLNEKTNEWQSVATTMGVEKMDVSTPIYTLTMGPDNRPYLAYSSLQNGVDTATVEMLSLPCP